MLIDHSTEEVSVPQFMRTVQWLVGINQLHFDPEGGKAEALAELMGPGATIPEVERVKKNEQLVHYIRGNSEHSDSAEYVQKA